MQGRKKIQVTVGCQPRIHGWLSQLAEQYEMTINEIVRECVENDLHRLKERERKRIKKREKA
jgi:hypothetical protein